MNDMTRNCNDAGTPGGAATTHLRRRGVVGFAQGMRSTCDRDVVAGGAH